MMKDRDYGGSCGFRGPEGILVLEYLINGWLIEGWMMNHEGWMMNLSSFLDRTGVTEIGLYLAGTSGLSILAIGCMIAVFH